MVAVSDAFEGAKPFSAGESRAQAMQLESVYGIPQGLYQAVVENKTGWRQDNPLLPVHRQSEEAINREAAMQQAAERLVQKYREFDGIAPLAIDAYYRGDKATRASISGAGFPQGAVDNVYRTLARVPKFGGEEVSSADAQAMAALIGQPSGDYSKLANSPSPKPVQAIRLQQKQDGRYFTGDTFLDAVLMIESGGDTNAVSPTGAAGLFQFTRGTGKRYGLFGKNGEDYRKNPELNLRAMQQLTADNARYLQSKGIEVTPASLYLAHNQGAGGAVEIIRAAQTGRAVSPNVRENMNLNNGRGKTPAQFYAMFSKKVYENMQTLGGAQVLQSGFAQKIAQHQPKAGQAVAQPMAQVRQAQGAREGVQRDSDVPVALLPSQHQSLQKKALIEQVFGLDEESKSLMPSNLREALRGMLAELS